MTVLRRALPLKAAMLCLAMLLLAFVPAVATAAEPPQLSWTVHTNFDPNLGSGPVASAISCPTQTQCTLLDGGGNEVTFNPQSPSPSSAPMAADSAISCPSTSLCVAANGSGGIVTFSPAAPTSTAHGFQLDASGNPLSLSCPTANECVAVESASGGDPGEITFNPSAPPNNVAPVSIDPGGQGLKASCPATLSNFCVAVDEEGNEVTFNPSSPSDAKVVLVSPHNFMTAVACPLRTTGECVGLTALNGDFVTFNPSQAGGAAAYPITQQDNSWGAFDCSTPNICTAIDSQGDAATFDPTITSSSVTQTVTPVSGAAGTFPVAVSCPEDETKPSQIECVELDYAGDVAVGTGTIAPPKPSCTVRAKSTTIPLPPVDGQPVEGNEGQLVLNVFCRPAAGSIAITLNGKLTEKNGQQTSTFPLKVSGSAQGGTTLALTAQLPTAAVTGLEHGAQESVAITLSASGAGGASTGSLQISKLTGVPAPAQPTQLVWTSVKGFDPNANTVSISCPSTTQCTLLDASGNEITFNPLSPNSGSSPVPIGTDWAIACPSTTECVATDASGGEITFDPANPPSVPSPVALDPHGTPLNVSCPTTTLCAAVETSSPSGAIGGGGEITFNPTSVSSNATPTTISPNQGPLWVACPAGVSDVCVAVDGGQNEITFNPSSPSQSKPSVMVQNDTLFAVACAPGVSTQCTAMGNGPAYTFNPGAPGSVTTLPTDDTAGWDAMTCLSRLLCTAVDSLGHVLTFDPIINPAPTFQGLDIDGQEPLVAVSCPDNPANPAQFECVAIDDIGNVFVGIPKPPPPPKPSCTVSAQSNQVLLPAKNSQPPTGKEGKLFFGVKCTPTAGVGLTGKLTEVLTTSGKKTTSTFTLTKVTGTAHAGSTLPLTVTLPRAAVTGLEKNAQESVAMTLTATASSGTSTFATRIPKLFGKRI